MEDKDVDVKKSIKRLDYVLMFTKITTVIIYSNIVSFLLKYAVEALAVVRQYKISRRV